MSQEANMRRVTAIKNGTVIDHVPAGKALSVLKMLGIEGDMSNPVSLVMNVPSKKMGGKDIIKVCLLYTSPSPRDMRRSRMPSSA